MQAVVVVELMLQMQLLVELVVLVVVEQVQVV
jgi:hypothetical protein